MSFKMNDTISPIVTATTSATNTTHAYQTKELNLFYAICEIVVAVIAVAGNALVIYVFKKERRLRRRTNYYIISLATADFLVGLLGIPFAILSSIGLPTNLHACVFTVSLLVVLCTISIFCLVAVSVDRYWAILHPMGYSRNVRTKTALNLMLWGAGRSGRTSIQNGRVVNVNTVSRQINTHWNAECDDADVYIKIMLRTVYVMDISLAQLVFVSFLYRSITNLGNTL